MHDQVERDMHVVLHIYDQDSNHFELQRSLSRDGYNQYKINQESKDKHQYKSFISEVSLK